MGSEFTYSITKVAATNIRNTMDYIRDELLNPAAAKKLYDDLIACFHRICAFPEIGAPLVNTFAPRDDLRYCYVGNFTVIYYAVYDEHVISIASVKYAHSDLNEALKRL